MAREIEVVRRHGEGSATAKVRNPWGTFGLGVITIGGQTAVGPVASGEGLEHPERP